MKLILKISDFLLSTYLFIASAAACLVLETTILLTGKLQFTATSMLVFFSTILIYNFHRVSALFSDRFFSLPAFLDRSKKIPLSIKIMTGIALAGILISVTFVNIKTMFIILPLALLTFAYSVPLMKVKGEIKRLRELFLVKITTLAFVWSIATVTLPMVDSGINALSESAIAIFTERFLFMFAICVPFEIRDLDQEIGRAHV